MVNEKPAAKKPAAHSAKPKAAKAKKTATHHPASHPAAEILPAQSQAAAPKMEIFDIAPIEDGRYIFATGRRKTSVANVRMFSGKGDSLVNKKPLEKYFSFAQFVDVALKPFDVTGQRPNFYFTATVNGGGLHSQAQALRHGISIALSKLSEEVRKVLKKNGLLTRDDRKKERKKPGLKRARRSPQWAKR